MGMKPRKPRRPKHPGDKPKRSGRTKIVWAREKIRLVAIDLPTNDPFPCKLDIEVLSTRASSDGIWVDSSASATLLEKELAFDLMRATGKLPKFATPEHLKQFEAKELVWENKLREHNKCLGPIKDKNGETVWCQFPKNHKRYSPCSYINEVR